MQEEEKQVENSTQNDSFMDIAEGANGRVYELGYLLVPTITEEDAPTNYGNLKALIGSLEGEVISDEMPKMLGLAYTMLKVFKNVRNRYDTAYFGWIKFEMSPDKVLELKKKLDLEKDIIRFLITKTVKENTIAAKRFVHRDIARKKTPTAKKEGESEATVEISKEEIDKEIDALVTV